MADYLTHFSCTLDVGAPENVDRALDLYDTATTPIDDLPLSRGFFLSSSLHSLQPCERRISFFDDALGCFEELATDYRWPGAGVGSFEQLRFQAVVETAERTAQCRLANVQDFGSLAEATMLSCDDRPSEISKSNVCGNS